MGADSPSAGQSSPLPSLALMALAVGISVANPFMSSRCCPRCRRLLACKAAGFLLLLPLGDGTERRRMLTLLAIGMALGFVLERQGAGTPQN